MKKLFWSFGVGALMLSAFLPLTLAHAQSDSKFFTLEETGIEYGRYTGLGSKDVRNTVADIIKVAISLLGIVALVIMLIGGFIWMTAGGNDEKIGEAKKWMFAGVIGLAIILAAYSLTSFIITQLVTATTK